jgi:hypothetical protein
VVHPLDLLHNLADAGHEAFGIMVMQDVHIDTLIATSEESFSIAVCLDTSANGS